MFFFMYCQYCGAELPTSANFCPGCGKPTSNNRPHHNAPLLSKVFHFGALTYNKGAVGQINAWLAEQRINVKSIRVNPQLNRNIPFKFEVVPLRVEIQYVEDASAPIYQLDYFMQMKLIGTSTEKLEQSLDAWKKDNPQCHITHHLLCPIQTNNGNAATLYFLYQ